MKKTLAEVIREGRKAKKMDQGELASVTGLSQGYISELETGTKSPGPKAIRLLSIALDLDMQHLSSLLNPNDAMPKKYTEAERRLIQALRTGNRPQAVSLFNGLLP